MSRQWLTLLSVFVIGCTACLGETAIIQGGTTGTLVVSVSTRGEALDLDGYTVTVSGVPGKSIESDGMVTFDALFEGDYTVALAGIATNCMVEGANPRSVSVMAGRNSETSFDVLCVAASQTGTVEVVTATSGDELDPDGYTLTLDGRDPVNIGVNAAITLEGVIGGEHELALSGVSANCTVSGENPRTVTVAAGQTTSTTFEVTCEVTDGTGLAEVVVPSASDFTDRGMGFGPSSGGWDARLSAGAPGTIVKMGSTYYAYYIGADGNRPSDGGPAHRAVGLVTSTDGVNWTKHSANPVIPWSELNANGDDEEGAWRLAVTKDSDGMLLMYVTVLKGSGGTVAGPIHLFTSSDGIDWTDRGQVIDPGDSGFPGSDEFGVLGAAVHDGTYHLYYTAKGSEDWTYSEAAAGTRDGFVSGQVLLDTGSSQVRYGSNPVRISETEWLLPFGTYRGGDIRLYRTTDLASLGTLDDTWTGLDADEGNFALYLDRDAGVWLMLLASAADEGDDDWSEVRVFTAPMTLAN